jgi:hypothetical protein
VIWIIPVLLDCYDLAWKSISVILQDFIDVDCVY